MLQCSHMGSVNKVILIGNLGKDAETKFIPSGTSVTTFNLATTRKWKDQQSGEWKEQTDWHRVKEGRAENVATYLLKDKQVYVEGRLETRSYDDKDGKKVYTTEVVCEHLVLLGSRQEGGGAAPDEYSQQPVSMPRSAARPAAVAPAAPPPPAGRRSQPVRAVRAIRRSCLQPRHHRRRRAVLAEAASGHECRANLTSRLSSPIPEE